MRVAAKPKNCLNCFSEDILGPYVDRNGFQTGWITFIRQVFYVCAECGHTMHFTVHGDRKRLLKERKLKQAKN